MERYIVVKRHKFRVPKLGKHGHLTVGEATNAKGLERTSVHKLEVRCLAQMPRMFDSRSIPFNRTRQQQALPELSNGSSRSADAQPSITMIYLYFAACSGIDRPEYPLITGSVFSSLHH